jgi:hypothetical protein
MVKRLRSYGIEDARYELLKFLGCIRAPSRLKILSPVERDRKGKGSPFPWVLLGNDPLGIYERLRKDIEGNIVMVISQNPIGMTRTLHRTEKFMPTS